MLHAMIMAGGGGTRFWPRSRTAKPKQFLTLAGDRSLLQLAFDRLEGPVPRENMWVVTSAAHVAEARKHLPEIPADHVVGEPQGRDTAPCIAMAAAIIHSQDAAATMIVTPADHVIEPAAEFRRALQAAAAVMEEHPNALMTFGIAPTYPSIGYGYIQRGEEIAQRSGIPAFRVKAFQEKPKADVAARYLADGHYYWNAGIFVWKTAAILAELKRNKPLLHDGAMRIADAWATSKRATVLAAEYPNMEKISIDFAVMEKAAEVLVIRAPYQWDDVGSWLALERLNPQDVDGNTVLGRHVGLNTKNCVIVGDSANLVTTIGVSNLLIVRDGDAVLVADKNDEAAVKQLVDRLKASGLENHL